MLSQSSTEYITCRPFHTEQVNPRVAVYLLDGKYRSFTLSVWGRLVSTYRCFANISHFALMGGMTLPVAVVSSQRVCLSVATLLSGNTRAKHSLLQTSYLHG